MTYAIVTGGRSYTDREAVFAALDRINPDLIFHGGATGADALAAAWADERGRPSIVMPAPWKGLGRSAGPKRNGWLLAAALRLAKDYARLCVVAFPGGQGTADMVRRAEEAGVEVVR